MDLATRTAWIFDMDGTLTVPAHDFDAIRAELGLRPRTPILEQLAEMADAEHLLERLDRIEREIAEHAVAQNGARELLEVLTTRKARLGILTRNSYRNAVTTLAHCALDRFFDPDDILGREACAPKPSADGIRVLLARWRVESAAAVMVGDFLFDLVAGREANTATVYVDLAGGGAYQAHADVVVGDLGELRRLVESGSAGPSPRTGS